MDRLNLVSISDPADPAIDEFRDIKERDLTGRSHQFIAEGAVVLRMLAEAHVRKTAVSALKILILDKKLDGIKEILDLFPSDIPIYVASASVLDQIAGFHLHRGILALGQRLEQHPISTIIQQLPTQSLVLIGIGMANHDNVGSMFRNAAAFGVDHFFLDQTSCDPLYRKAIRVSVGSVLNLPWTRGATARELIQQLADNQFEIWGLSPAGVEDIRSIALPQRVALVMGTEGEGLPQHLLQHIKTARISQMPGLDSLNLGTATGIALFQAATSMGRI